MRSKFKKMLTYFLLSAIILPGWVLGSSLFQKPESAQAATQVGGGGNIVGGIINSVGLNPVSIIAGEDGDIDSSGINISISSNTSAKLEFDTLFPVAVVPSSNINLGSGNGVTVNVFPTAHELDIPIATASAAKDQFVVIAGIHVKATASGSASTFTGTENLLIETAGGTIEGSPIIVDAQYPNFTGIVSAPKYAKVGNVDLSFTASKPLMGNPDVTVNGNPATFVSVLNLIYHYNYAVTAADIEGQATIKIVGPDANFNFDPAGVTDIQALFIDMTNPSVPANVSAITLGKNIQVSWNAAHDVTGSGIAGYNLYRSDNAYATAINPALITATNYIDTPAINGNFDYKVEAVDMAGNLSAKSVISNQVNFNSALPLSPTDVTTSVSNHLLTINWSAVSGGVAGYIVTINGVSRDVDNVTTYSVDLDYGTYTVLVTSYFSADNYGINDVSGLNEVKNAATVAGLEKSVTLVSVVKTSAVNEPRIAPQAAEAAPVAETPAVTSTPPASADNATGLQPDTQGQVKGQEESTQTTEEKINWTPWIILFVLIILAGAATGGYFYWFAGEEEAETKVKSKPEVEKKEIVKPKTKDSSSKKPRRW